MKNLPTCCAPSVVKEALEVTEHEAIYLVLDISNGSNNSLMASHLSQLSNERLLEASLGYDAVRTLPMNSDISYFVAARLQPLLIFYRCGRSLWCLWIVPESSHYTFKASFGFNCAEDLRFIFEKDWLAAFCCLN